MCVCIMQTPDYVGCVYKKCMNTPRKNYNYIACSRLVNMKLQKGPLGGREEVRDNDSEWESSFFAHFNITTNAIEIKKNVNWDHAKDEK